jgi:hypothetical protein
MTALAALEIASLLKGYIAQPVLDELVPEFDEIVAKHAPAPSGPAGAVREAETNDQFASRFVLRAKLAVMRAAVQAVEDAIQYEDSYKGLGKAINELAPQIAEALAAAPPGVVADGWRPIESAPHWPENWEYLVGTWNGESWSKVDVWNPTWSRDSMKQRGATHVRLVGRPI